MNDGKSGRNADGTFTAGNAGKPRGTRHKATQAVLALLQGAADALSRKAVEKWLWRAMAWPCGFALTGSHHPAKTTLSSSRCPAWPLPTMLHRPLVRCWKLYRWVSLPPAEGAVIMGLIDGYRRTLETSELEARVAALEESK